jgi:hypothetical protein
MLDERAQEGSPHIIEGRGKGCEGNQSCNLVQQYNARGNPTINQCCYLARRRGLDSISHVTIVC